MKIAAMENENFLLQKVSEGDENAFKFLFNRHKSKLYNYLFRLTKSKTAAEELTVDVFLKIWLCRQLLPEIKNLDAFLHKVAHNKALDYFRVVARNKGLQKIASRQLENTIDCSTDSHVLTREYNEIFYKALNDLSPQRKMVFALSRVQGLTHEEIAVKLQLSRNTVRNTIAETLKHVRRFLHAHEIETWLN